MREERGEEPGDSSDERPGGFGSGALVICGTLIAANLAAWLWAWASFAGHPALLGGAVLAYVFGLRHAVDADHIAAIDNVVRKLMQQGRAPHAAGLFFSLGHSTVVFAAAAAVAVAATAMHGRLAEFQAIGGVIGTAVSALFLLAIGVANLCILRRVWQAFLRVRRGGAVSDAGLGEVLAGRGFLVRLLRPVFRLVDRSWHMYPVGVLFGLGFDTATEVGVVVLAATEAAQGTSLLSVMVFPALFTAGMALVDTADSMMMTGAYGWAFAEPIRKLGYNLVVTAASAVLALFIGGVEALGLIGGKLGLGGSIWAAIGAIDDDIANLGFAVIGALLAAWLLSVLLFRRRTRAASESAWRA